jgi:hypothetical protein
MAHQVKDEPSTEQIPDTKEVILEGDRREMAKE